jgi:hypothetical protein
MNYFVPVHTLNPTRKAFMYMDAADEYHADSLLQKNNVHAKFSDNVFVSPDGRYRFVFCTIPKAEVGRFEKAIGELPSRMLLLGYEDYIDTWERMAKFLVENRK